jgi:hypothetical protein
MQYMKCSNYSIAIKSATQGLKRAEKYFKYVGATILESTHSLAYDYLNLCNHVLP